MVLCAIFPTARINKGKLCIDFTYLATCYFDLLLEVVVTMMKLRKRLGDAMLVAPCELETIQNAKEPFPQHAAQKGPLDPIQ